MPTSTPGTFSDFFSQLPSEVFALGFVFIGVFVVCIFLIIFLRLRRLGGSTQPNALEIANEQLARALSLSQPPQQANDEMPDLDMLLSLDAPRPAPTPTPIASPSVELSVSRDPKGRLMVQLGQTLIQEGESIPLETQIKLEALLAEINLLAHPVSSSQPPIEILPQAPLNMSINPFFDFLPMAEGQDTSSPFVLDEPVTDRDPTPIPVGGYPSQSTKTKSSAILQESDVASQINAILQNQLGNHPTYGGRFIHLRGGASGTIRIQIDQDFYENVKDIPDKQIQLLIAKAVKTWQTLNQT
ncbi:MAG: hypothetical protein ACOYLB_00255 [Phototrophicaceae bacterium]